MTRSPPLLFVLCVGCMSEDMHRAALAASLVDALAGAQSYWADAVGPAQSLYVPFEGVDGNVSGTMIGTPPDKQQQGGSARTPRWCSSSSSTSRAPPARAM